MVVVAPSVTIVGTTESTGHGECLFMALVGRPPESATSALTQTLRNDCVFPGTRNTCRNRGETPPLKGVDQGLGPKLSSSDAFLPFEGLRVVGCRNK